MKIRKYKQLNSKHFNGPREKQKREQHAKDQKQGWFQKNQKTKNHLKATQPKKEAKPHPGHQAREPRKPWNHPTPQRHISDPSLLITNNN